MTSAMPHWATGTTHSDVGDVLDAVHAATGGADFVARPGRFRYGTRYVTVEGIEVLCDPGNPATMPPVCVNVPGAGCEYLGAAALQELVVGAGLKLTRLDFAWDGVPFTVADVVGWIENRNMRTRLRAAKGHPTLMGPGGDGVTLGTRNGTAEVVVYDRRGPVRLEMRLRGVRAAAAVEVLALDPGAWSGAFCELLRGVVDFVDRADGQRPDRADLLPSWESFVQGAQRVVVALTGAVTPSLERSRAWVERQVAKTLYKLDQAGVSVRELVELGRKRMLGADRVQLAGWLRGPPGSPSTAGVSG